MQNNLHTLATTHLKGKIEKLQLNLTIQRDKTHPLMLSYFQSFILRVRKKTKFRKRNFLLISTTLTIKKAKLIFII